MGRHLFFLFPSFQSFKLFFNFLGLIKIGTQFQTRGEAFHTINIVNLPLLLIGENLIGFANALEVLSSDVFHLKDTENPIESSMNIEFESN